MLLLTVTAAMVTQAQNYRIFQRSGLSLFGDKNKNILTYQVNKVEAAGSDSVYAGILTVSDTSYVSASACYDTSGGTLYGSRMIMNPNGNYSLINKDHDTIRIQSRAPLNGAWNFFRLSPTSWLEATIIAKQKLNFLGQSDSVKTIRLLAKDNNNINISHPLNNTTLLLSKNYGLLKTFSFYGFPYDTVSFNLIGATAPVIGKQNLTMRKVYDFSVGDVFHLKKYNLSWQDLGGTWQVYSGYNSVEIRTVISKYVSAGSDTVIYEFLECSKNLNYANFFCDTTYRTDTIVESYVFSEMDTAGFERQPYEFVYSGSGNGLKEVRMFYHSWHGRVARAIKDEALYKQDSCWLENNALPSIAFHTFIDQCGGPYYSYGMNGQEVAVTLEYFKKGSEVWGTPVADDCPNLFSAVPDLQPAFNPRVYPNPAQEFIHVSVPGNQKGQIEIRDLQGRLLKTKVTADGMNTIPVGDLPGGVYLLRVVTEKSTQSFRIVVQP